MKVGDESIADYLNATAPDNDTGKPEEAAKNE